MRARHTTAKTPRHAGCCALRSPMWIALIFRLEARHLVGASGRQIYFFLQDGDSSVTRTMLCGTSPSDMPTTIPQAFQKLKKKS